MRTKHITLWLSALVLLSAFALWSGRLADPFIGRHDNNTAFITLAAQNYWRYGHLNLGFAQTLDADPSRSTPSYYYNNHPPLTSLLVSLALPAFGDNELTARLVIIFFMLLGAAALFRFVKRYTDAVTAFWALLFYLAAPLVAYYGQMMNHEPLVLSLFLLTLSPYLYLTRVPSTRGYAAVAALTAMMVLAAWQALFFVGALVVHGFFFAVQRGRLVLTLATSATLTLAGWLLLMTLYVPDFWQTLLGAFTLRSGGAERPWSGLPDYAWQIAWGRLRPGYTEALLVLAFLGGLFLLWRFARVKNRSSTGLILLILVPAMLQVIVFSEQTFRHDYTLLYFAPGLALLGAHGLLLIWRTAANQPSMIRYALRGFAIVALIAFAGTRLASNIDWWPAVWYYAERDVIGSTSDDTRLPYMHCSNTLGPANAVQAGGLSCTFD